MAFLAKAATGAFKALGKISVKKWKGMKKGMDSMKGMNFQGIMQFVMQLKVVQYLLKPITALFKVFINAIMKPLYPILKPIVNALLKLMPLAEELGTLLGEFLGEKLEPLIPLILDIIDAFAELAPIIMEVIFIFLELNFGLLYELLPTILTLLPPIMMLVGSLMELFVAIWPIIRPFIMITAVLVELLFAVLPITPAIEKLSYYIIWLAHHIKNVRRDVDNLSISTMWLIDAFKDLYRWIDDLADLANSISGGGDGNGGDDDWSIWGGYAFDEGTLDFGPKPGLALLHPHEAVIPADMKGDLGKTININVNLTGAVLTNELDLRNLADMLSEKIFVELG